MAIFEILIVKQADIYIISVINIKKKKIRIYDVYFYDVRNNLIYYY